MFKLVVVPVFRTGLLLALPGLTIEMPQNTAEFARVWP